MDWFKPSAGAARPAEVKAEAPAVEVKERGTEAGGLDFKSAVDAHMKWKKRLEAYINGTSTETLKVEVVCRDDQCPLGKWIYDRGGREFGYSETFFDMKAHHANFHRAAGDVLSAAQAGEKEKALELLHYGDYVRASERVKKLLAKLFVLVMDGRTAIDAHIKWKERLHDYIAGRGEEELQVDNVSRDDLCSLGVWIKGDGAQHHGDSPIFKKVVAAHALFHQRAGEVLALAKQGRREEAVHMLDEGAYAEASDEVTSALVELFAKPA